MKAYMRSLLLSFTGMFLISPAFGFIAGEGAILERRVGDGEFSLFSEKKSLQTPWHTLGDKNKKESNPSLSGSQGTESHTQTHTASASGVAEDQSSSEGATAGETNPPSDRYGQILSEALVDVEVDWLVIGYVLGLDWSELLSEMKSVEASSSNPLHFFPSAFNWEDENNLKQVVWALAQTHPDLTKSIVTKWRQEQRLSEDLEKMLCAIIEQPNIPLGSYIDEEANLTREAVVLLSRQCSEFFYDYASSAIQQQVTSEKWSKAWKFISAYEMLRGKKGFKYKKHPRSHAALILYTYIFDECFAQCETLIEMMVEACLQSPNKQVFAQALHSAMHSYIKGTEGGTKGRIWAQVLPFVADMKENVCHSSSGSESATHVFQSFTFPFNVKVVGSLIRSGDFDNVVSMLQEEVQPEALTLVKDTRNFSLGLAFFKKNSPTESSVYFKSMHEGDQRDHVSGSLRLAYAYLGDIAFNGKKYREAQDYYRLAIAHFAATPEVTDILRMVPVSLSMLYAKLGSALRGGGDASGAIKAYKTAIGHANSQKDKLSINTSLGNLYQAVGDNNQALEHYGTARVLAEELRDYVSLGWMQGNIGNAYLGLYDKAKALEHLKKSLELTKQHEPTPQAIGRAHNNLGTAYQSLNDLDEAKKHYDRALSQAVYGQDTAGKVRVSGNLGNIFMLRKEYEKSFPYYADVLELSQDEEMIALAHHNRGCAYYDWTTQQIEKAVTPLNISEVPWTRFDQLAPSTYDAHVHFMQTPDVEASQKKVQDKANKLLASSIDDLCAVINKQEGDFARNRMTVEEISLIEHVLTSNVRTSHRLQDGYVLQNQVLLALMSAEQSRQRSLSEWHYHKGAQVYSLPLDQENLIEVIKKASAPVVYFSFTGARLLIWLIKPDAIQPVIKMISLPASNSQFSGKSFDYMMDNLLTRQLSGNASQLSDLLEFLKPVAKAISALLHEYGVESDMKKRVIFCGDKYTQKIPLNLLPFYSDKGEEKGVLADHLTPLWAPSLFEVAHWPASSQKIAVADASQVLAIGDNGVSSVAYSKKSADQVSQFLGGSACNKGFSSVDALKEQMEQADIIYLAVQTHQQAGGSHVAFYSDKTEELVGRALGQRVEISLRPEEIAQMKLKARLVVLENSYDDEGRSRKLNTVEKMSKAFMMAGVQSVIISARSQLTEGAFIQDKALFWLLRQGVTSAEATASSNLILRSMPDYGLPDHWIGLQHFGPGIILNTPGISGQSEEGLLFDHELRHCRQLGHHETAEGGPVVVHSLRNISTAQLLSHYLAYYKGTDPSKVFWINYDEDNAYLLDAVMASVNTAELKDCGSDLQNCEGLMIVSCHGNLGNAPEKLSDLLQGKGEGIAQLSAEPGVIMVSEVFDKPHNSDCMNYLSVIKKNPVLEEHVKPQLINTLHAVIACRLAGKGLLASPLIDESFPLRQSAIMAGGNPALAALLARYLINEGTDSALLDSTPLGRAERVKTAIADIVQQMQAEIQEKVSQGIISLMPEVNTKTEVSVSQQVQDITSQLEELTTGPLEEKKPNRLAIVLLNRVIEQVLQGTDASSSLEASDRKGGVWHIMQVLSWFEARPVPQFFIHQLLQEVNPVSTDLSPVITVELLEKHGLLMRYPLPVAASGVMGEEKMIPFEIPPLYSQLYQNEEELSQLQQMAGISADEAQVKKSLILAYNTLKSLRQQVDSSSSELTNKYIYYLAQAFINVIGQDTDLIEDEELYGIYVDMQSWLQ